MSGYLERGLAVPRLGTFPGRGSEIGRTLVGSLPYLLLLAFILVIYTSPGVLFKPLAAVGPAQVVGGLALAALLMERAINRRGFDLVWPESYLLMAFLWVGALSCFDAVWARLSFNATLDVLKYVLISLLIVNVVTTAGRLRGVMATMVLGGLAPTLGTLKNYVTGEIHPGERVHWVGIFANSNDLSYSLVLLIPLAAVLALDRPGWRRPMFWGAIAAYVAAIYITYSRGSLLALVAVLLLVALRQRSRSIRILVLALIAASLVFVAFFWGRSEGFMNLSDFTFQQRITTILTGLKMFMDRPLLGVGLGGSIAAFPFYAGPDVNFRESLVVHNTVVQALSEVGLIGCVLFLAVIGSAIYHARRSARGDSAAAHPRVAAFLAALEVAMWGYVICGIFGPYMMSWFPYILVGLISAARRLMASPADVRLSR